MAWRTDRAGDAAENWQRPIRAAWGHALWSAQFRSIIVSTGTYTVVGAAITFRPFVARAPEVIGGEAAAECTIEGDTLRLRLPEDHLSCRRERA